MEEKGKEFYLEEYNKINKQCNQLSNAIDIMVGSTLVEYPVICLFDAYKKAIAEKTQIEIKLAQFGFNTEKEILTAINNFEYVPPELWDKYLQPLQTPPTKAQNI